MDVITIFPTAKRSTLMILGKVLEILNVVKSRYLHTTMSQSSHSQPSHLHAVTSRSKANITGGLKMATSEYMFSLEAVLRL